MPSGEIGVFGSADSRGGVIMDTHEKVGGSTWRKGYRLRQRRTEIARGFGNQSKRERCGEYSG